MMLPAAFPRVVSVIALGLALLAVWWVCVGRAQREVVLTAPVSVLHPGRGGEGAAVGTRDFGAPARTTTASPQPRLSAAAAIMATTPTPPTAAPGAQPAPMPMGGPEFAHGGPEVNAPSARVLPATVGATAPGPLVSQDTPAVIHQGRGQQSLVRAQVALPAPAASTSVAVQFPSNAEPYAPPLAIEHLNSRPLDNPEHTRQLVELGETFLRETAVASVGSDGQPSPVLESAPLSDLQSASPIEPGLEQEVTWQLALQESDQRYRILFGENAYQQLQLQRMQALLRQRREAAGVLPRVDALQ